MTTAVGAAMAAGEYASNSEARRGVAGDGLYLNDERVTDAAAPLPEPLHGRFWIVRTGRRRVWIVERSR